MEEGWKDKGMREKGLKPLVWLGGIGGERK